METLINDETEYRGQGAQFSFFHLHLGPINAILRCLLCMHHYSTMFYSYFLGILDSSL